MLGFRFDDLDAGVGENLEVNLVGGMVDDVPRILATPQREFHVVTMAP